MASARGTQERISPAHRAVGALHASPKTMLSSPLRSAWLVDVATAVPPSVCAATASGALLVDDEEGCPAQCAGEFLSRHPSGRPPLATAAASELLSNILGDNWPRLVGLGPGIRSSLGRILPTAIRRIYNTAIRRRLRARVLGPRSSVLGPRSSIIVVFLFGAVGASLFARRR